MHAVVETSKGTINFRFQPKEAPKTCENFVKLAKQGFYDNLTWHRVLPNFVIQGGCPKGDGTGGPGYQFEDEFVPALRMKPGVLAMANAGPGTNGSQFFITEVAPEHLNDHHTIFGQCKELDIVKAIARVPQDERNKPNTPVTINKLTISRMQSW